MELVFDVRGFLQPDTKITLSQESFRKVFVEDFGDNEKRNLLYQNLLNYTGNFQKQITPNFAQWIGGSFVSKTSNPRDLDLVTVINYKDFDSHAKKLDQYFRGWGAKERFGVDAYLLIRHPEGSKKHAIYQGDSLYWISLFTKAKKNRAKKSFSRGFVEIIYNNFQP